jgi:hypothetical protein
VAPAIGSASVESATSDAATVEWKSSEPSTTEVVYGATPESLGNASVEGTATSRHQITLDDLRPGTTYYYRVRSTDVTGRRTTWPPTSQEPLAFTTARHDSMAPKASAVKVLPLPDGTATVTWATDEPATSTVAFGTTPGQLAQKRTDDDLVLQHSVVLTGLRPDKTYWYRIGSSDGDGNGTTGPETGRVPLKFVSAAVGVADHSAAKFEMGVGSGVVVKDANSSSTGQLALSAQQLTGRYVSRVMDAGQMVTWDRATWRASVPDGATLRIYVRTGSTSKPNGSWTSWHRVKLGDVIGTDGRYIQYRIDATTSQRGRVPKLAAIGFANNGTPRLVRSELTN